MTAFTALADQARFLLSDKDAVQARVDIVQQAKKEILIEYFAVWDDEQAYAGMALLIQAARRGVKIKIIVDALANKLKDPAMTALMDQGVGVNGSKNIEVRVYNPLSPNPLKWSHRDHSKMIIVDGKLLLTGGRNIGDKYFGASQLRNYIDLDILLNGTSVQVARENYLKVWSSRLVHDPSKNSQFQRQLDPALCVHEDNESACLANVATAKSLVQKENARIEATLKKILIHNNGDTVRANTKTNWLEGRPSLKTVKFLSHRPDQLVREERAYLSHQFLQLLENTESEVSLVSPYIILTPPMMNAFRHLRARGVRIRIITNSLRTTDSVLAQAGYRFQKEALVKMGVEIYEYHGPETLHAKATLFDHKRVLVCTCNLDPRSAILNREVGILLEDGGASGLARELEEMLEDFRSQSILVAKDGVEFNQEKQFEGVGISKRRLLKYFLLLLPAVINQL
jgi:phosphatidylserine/phosphatidylglycerophosphate/cardiolipin synthase-like enzyme